MKVGFGDYETLDRQKLRVNTPRSLEAVRRAGLVPSDLVFTSFTEFRERELRFNGRNLLGSAKADEEVLQLRFKFAEAQRQEKLRLARD